MVYLNLTLYFSVICLSTFLVGPPRIYEYILPIPHDSGVWLGLLPEE